MLNKGKIGENYNIGGHNEWQNIDIVKLICGLMDECFADDETLAARFETAKAAIAGESESLITYVTDRPGHDRRYAIDAAKTRAELGYEPQESFETGIRKTVQWYLTNENWWKAVMDGSYQEWDCRTILILQRRKMNFDIIKRAVGKKKKLKATEGHLDGWNGNDLWGWAIDNETKRPVELDVCINGKIEKAIIANQFRQDLQDASKKDDGKAGFAVKFNVHDFLYQLDIDSENKIEVRNKTNGEKLIGSPVIVKKAKIRGNVDQLELHCMVGWITNDSYPKAPVIIDLYINDELKTTVTANQYRQDLADAGFESPMCGFSIDLTPFIGASSFAKLELKLRG